MYCITRFSQNDWETCQLAIVIPIEIFDHKLMTFINLQFVSNGSAIDSSFEINDIQIVYREKVRK